MPLGFDHAANRGLLVQLCDDRMGGRFAQLAVMRRWRGERGERHFNERAAQGGYLAQRLQGLDTAFDAFGSGGLSVDKLRGHARFSCASRGKVLPLARLEGVIEGTRDKSRQDLRRRRDEIGDRQRPAEPGLQTVEA
jgi:hypothetical protein